VPPTTTRFWLRHCTRKYKSFVDVCVFVADSAPPSPRNLLYNQLSVPGDVRAVLNEDGFVEEERQLLSGVKVRAASVSKLVALVVDCFGIHSPTQTRLVV